MILQTKKLRGSCAKRSFRKVFFLWNSDETLYKTIFRQLLLRNLEEVLWKSFLCVFSVCVFCLYFMCFLPVCFSVIFLCVFLRVFVHVFFAFFVCFLSVCFLGSFSLYFFLNLFSFFFLSKLFCLRFLSLCFAYVFSPYLFFVCCFVSGFSLWIFYVYFDRSDFPAYVLNVFFLSLFSFFFSVFFLFVVFVCFFLFRKLFLSYIKPEEGLQIFFFVAGTFFCKSWRWTGLQIFLNIKQHNDYFHTWWNLSSTFFFANKWWTYAKTNL